MTRVGQTYLFKDALGNEAGSITIYKFGLKIGKPKSLESKYQAFKILLKTEQFSKLDTLLNNALDEISKIVKNNTDNAEKLRFQNKYDGLNNIKRKIELAKRDYNEKPNNQLAFNKLLNLYNSLKNLL